VRAGARLLMTKTVWGQNAVQSLWSGQFAKIRCRFDCQFYEHSRHKRPSCLFLSAAFGLLGLWLCRASRSANRIDVVEKEQLKTPLLCLSL
jgi:hypothetical protein